LTRDHIFDVFAFAETYRNCLTCNFTGTVVDVKGTVTQKLESIRVVLVFSNNPAFAAMVEPIPAVQAVSEEFSVQWASPTLPLVDTGALEFDPAGVNIEMPCEDNYSLIFKVRALEPQRGGGLLRPP
jgi:hypothetical protein